MKTAFWLLISLFVLASSPALAMRCGTQLVLEGQSTYKVSQLCGPPQSQSQRVIYVTVGGWNGNVSVPIDVDEWIYDFGPGQLMQKLRFENDRLIRIRDLGYGN